jgi:hypothetical protein
MAIIAPQTAPNFATGNYHKILRGELICGPKEENPRMIVFMGFYASEAAREANGDPMYTHIITIPLSAMAQDPRIELYELAMQCDLYANTNATSDVS